MWPQIQCCPAVPPVEPAGPEAQLAQQGGQQQGWQWHDQQQEVGGGGVGLVAGLGGVILLGNCFF